MYLRSKDDRVLCGDGVDEAGGLPFLRRRLLLNLAGLSLVPLAACGKSGTFFSTAINLTVVMYSYLDRPIFAITFNDEALGAAGPYGTTSMVTGVTVPMGKQKLVWTVDGPEGRPGNGDVFSLKNNVVISAEAIPAHSDYLGLYLYPDNTAEITFHHYMPGHTPRGEALRKAAGRK
jgi:hypothetical protein